MTKKSYATAKGRRNTAQFISIPHTCLDHPNFTRLSTKAIRLLIDVTRQYNGFNNGDLSITFSKLKKRGWKSEGTLNRAKKELLHFQWITRTRVGPTIRSTILYALTFHNIDYCKGKLDVKPTGSSLGSWKIKTELL